MTDAAPRVSQLFAEVDPDFTIQLDP
jgi:hypothetical protein